MTIWCIALGQATVPVRREGEPSEITMVEAIVRKQHEAGLKGSVVAQKDALQSFYRVSEHKAAEAGLRLERWAKIKQSHAARTAETQTVPPHGRGRDRCFKRADSEDEILVSPPATMP